MKTYSQILIVLLLITENYAQELEILKTSELTQEITKDNATTNEELETLNYVATGNCITKLILDTTLEVTTDFSIKSKEIEENSTFIINMAENRLFSEQQGVSNVTNKAENEEVQIGLKVLSPITNPQEEIKNVSKKSTESRVNETTTTTTSSQEEFKDIFKKSTELKDKSEKSVINVTTITTNIKQDISENTTEYLINESTTILNNLDENKDIYANSTEPLVDETTISTTTTVDCKPNTKPLNTLEEFAVKQMNFILDHLLMETQEFVATVLQASVNTVFQRDYLKRYAEGLNRLLKPDTDYEYSDEINENKKVITQDDLYEEIVYKLNFLKSKSSKSLQKHLPQDWVNEYRNKRAEFAIWLDKASEQMHRKFNCFVSEKEDHIKYQYFSEAFDDISRATEIHHKLALLADLVKIVKNKRQITFMDLYMQT